VMSRIEQPTQLQLGLEMQVEDNEDDDDESDPPMDAAQLKKYLNKERFEKAIQCINEYDQVGEDVQFLLSRVNESLGQAGLLKPLEKRQAELHDELKALEKEMKDKEAEIWQLDFTLSEHEASLTQNTAQQGAITSHKGNLEKYKEVRIGQIKTELREIESKLAAATADEKNYTFKAYGDGHELWHRDAELATKKVARYQEDKNRLQKEQNDLQSSEAAKNLDMQLANLKGDWQKVTGKIAVEKEKRAKAVLQTNNTYVDEEGKSSIAKKIKEKQNEYKEKQKQIEDILSKNEAQDAEHLIGAQRAKQSFLMNAASSTDIAVNAQGGWQAQFTALEQGIGRVMRAKHAKIQQKKLGGCRTALSEMPVCDLMRNAQLLTLQPVIGREELKGLTPAQETEAQPVD